MKLLIVDDSAMIRRAVSSSYKGTVFTDIETAADGLLAVTAFKKLMPDVVTLDITMPYMDGLAAMSQMLEIRPNTIILVISALADHHTAIEALLRGAHQFICKPFSDKDLKDALDTLLAENVTKENDTDLIENKENDTLEGSRKLEQKLKDVTVPKHDQTPSKENYPSGYVKPPSRLDRLSNRIDNSAVGRQLSMKEGLHAHLNIQKFA